jgi:hypothetical protein
MERRPRIDGKTSSSYMEESVVIFKQHIPEGSERSIREGDGMNQAASELRLRTVDVHDILVPCAAAAFSKIEVVGVPERNIETTHKVLAGFAVRRYALVGSFDGFFLGF